MEAVDSKPLAPGPSVDVSASLTADNLGTADITLRCKNGQNHEKASAFYNSDNETTYLSPPKLPRRRVSDPLSQFKIDAVLRNESFHGTPRSVKHRSSANKV